MYYLTYKIFPPPSWKFLVYFLFAFDTESHYVSPTGPELSEICLLSAEIKAHIPSLGRRDMGRKISELQGALGYAVSKVRGVGEKEKKKGRGTEELERWSAVESARGS